MNHCHRGAWSYGLWAILALVLLPVLPAHAQALTVSSVEIQGEQRINEDAIRAVITTKVGDEFSAERVERDRANIEALGWFRQVAVARPVAQGNMVRVIFVVTEFPVVTNLQITGSTLFTQEQLLAAIKTRPGTADQPRVFNIVQWSADRNAINKLYADKGYLIRLIDNVGSATTPPEADFLDQGVVRLEIHELKVGKVTIKWPTREIKDKQGKVVRTVESHKTKNYVVTRELSQKSGALYNQTQLGKDYRALSGLGFFESVTPVQQEGEQLDTVDITWQLQEKRTGQVSVGAGYSPREHLLGRAELADTNFQGKGRAISIGGEIGTFGGDGKPSVEVNFFEPWLTPKKTSLNVSLYDKLIYRFSQDLVDINNEDNRYFERRLGGALTFGRPFGWPITTGLRYDDVNTGDLPTRFGFPRQDGTVIAGNVSRLWNTRDYVNNPTEGMLTRTTLEFGHASLTQTSGNAPFDSSFFTKAIVDYRRYYRLRGLKATKEPNREQESQKVPVIAVRAMAGHIFGDVPFFEQFFVGGAESLRGYLEDRFWGRSMYLGSIEYRRPLMKSITGVLFADIGDAFDSDPAFRFRGSRFRTDFRQHNDLRPFASIGIGLRVQTPIGAIRLDFGYGEEGGRTHFSIGQAF